MKSIKLLIGIILFLLYANVVMSQNENKAIVFGQLFYVSSFDTLKLKNTRFELIKIEVTGKEIVEGNSYTDSEGRYKLTKIPFGVYYIKVYAGPNEILFHRTATSQNEKGPVFNIDLELKMISPQYVSKKSELTILQGVYTIQQKSTYMYADAFEGGNDNNMVTRSWQNDDTQRWIFTHLGNNTYTIQQKSTYMYVDAFEGGNDNNMVTRPWQNNDTQGWILTPLGNNTYTIQQKSTNMYMDAFEGSDDNSMVTRYWQNNDTQKWIIMPNP